MSEYDEPTVKATGLQAGDLILQVFQHSINDDTYRVRRKRPVELPTVPYTAIHSTWDSSGGVAEFDAMLLPPRFNVFTSRTGEEQMWLLDDGRKMQHNRLALLISYYDVKAEPVEP